MSNILNEGMGLLVDMGIDQIRKSDPQLAKDMSNAYHVTNDIFNIVSVVKGAAKAGVMAKQVVTAVKQGGNIIAKEAKAFATVQKRVNKALKDIDETGRIKMGSEQRLNEAIEV